MILSRRLLRMFSYQNGPDRTPSQRIGLLLQHVEGYHTLQHVIWKSAHGVFPCISGGLARNGLGAKVGRIFLGKFISFLECKMSDQLYPRRIYVPYGCPAPFPFNLHYYAYDEAIPPLFLHADLRYFTQYNAMPLTLYSRKRARLVQTIFLLHKLFPVSNIN